MQPAMQPRIYAILQQAGLDVAAPLQKASGGQRHQVWFCGRYVIRLNHQSHGQLLQREADLLACLDGQVPCPKVYAVGVDEFGEWSIQHRVAGRPLAHVWPDLAPVQQQKAVAQIAGFVRRLHQLPVDGLTLSVDPTFQELHTQIATQVEKCRHFPYVDPALMEQIVLRSQVLSQQLDKSSAQMGLVHHDLHFDNVLWDGENVSALLDYEKASYAPLEADLDLFLRYCAFPHLFVQEEYEQLARAKDYQHVPRWFAETYPELFQIEQLHDRLSIYSLAYDLHLLAYFPPRAPVEPHHADALMNRLRAVVEQRGYIANLLRFP